VKAVGTRLTAEETAALESVYETQPQLPVIPSRSDSPLAARATMSGPVEAPIRYVVAGEKAVFYPAVVSRARFLLAGRRASYVHC